MAPKSAKPAAKRAPESDKKKLEDPDAEVVKEFGGPIGNIALCIWSHCIVYYIWICMTYYGGALSYPTSVEDIVPWADRMWTYVIEDAWPTWYAVQIYGGFIIFQAILAVTMPGVKATGLPVPSEGGKALVYNCNALYSWYVTLIVVAVLHYTGIFALTEVINNWGRLATVAIIFADITSVVAHVTALAMGRATRMSGNLIYDWFMGAWLNPRIGTFDLKFWAETRVAWITLFLLSAAAALKQYELEGTICPSMAFIILAQGLYTNAIMKGEECIPPTWDIYYEKWGWMLIYWNFAGVPFVYCAQAMYIMRKGLIQLPTWFMVALVVALLGAYYIWDTSQSQKNRFRMQLRGTYIPRYTFPQLPWGTLPDPSTGKVSFMKTKMGTLLTDGWWRYARKIHYTCDVIMAWTWGLCCGFENFLPFFYAIFFMSMILHRYFRDTERCARKYQKDWDEYCRRVPYAFIPFVF